MDYSLEREKISSYDDKKLESLNKYLFQSLYAGTAQGFANGDMGHSAYRMGVDGDENGIDEDTWGDGPEENELYQLLRALHGEMNIRRIPIERPICLWSDFCSVVIEAYEQLQNNQKI